MEFGGRSGFGGTSTTLPDLLLLVVELSVEPYQPSIPLVVVVVVMRDTVVVGVQSWHR